MPKRYAKSDVQFHSENFRDGRPAVNVKVYGRLEGVTLPLELGSSYPVGHPELVEHHRTDPGFTLEWVEENVSEEALDSYFWQACADAWEALQSLAEDIWGKGRTVYSEGRSGGWAIVEGLPPFDAWDAVDLGRWRKFERLARLMADDIPRTLLESVYMNEWPNSCDMEANDHE